MKILIIGLGIGQVYKEQCLLRGYQVVTVDNKLPADYNDLKDCFMDHIFFNLALICTPNYLHEIMIHMVAPYSNIVLVEKPGLKTLRQWKKICGQYPKKIIMVKNNIYRKQLCDLKNIFHKNFKNIDEMRLNWNSINRIPHPGYWFTNKKESFGGVSYDLGPHLINMLQVILKGGISDYFMSGSREQLHCMNDITSTQYGKINRQNPVYDVDDVCLMKFNYKDVNILVELCWKTKNKTKDEQNIEIFFKEGGKLIYEFGLCPNSMYGEMINDVLANLNYDFHYNLDCDTLKIITELIR